MYFNAPFCHTINHSCSESENLVIKSVEGKTIFCLLGLLNLKFGGNICLKILKIWQFFRVILHFAQEYYYLPQKWIGNNRFYKSRQIGKISEPTGFQTLPVLGRLQNLLLPLYVKGYVSFLLLIQVLLNQSRNGKM